MAKGRYNPVQAYNKAEKVKLKRRGKAEVQTRRYERLARKDPSRIQRQIDDIQAIIASGGSLSKTDEETLQELKEELRSVNKARETLGEKAPNLGGSAGIRVLGKRQRQYINHEEESSGDEYVSEDVRTIPMPRDTPPPIPKEMIDRWWAKRRVRRNAERNPDYINSQHRSMNREDTPEEARLESDSLRKLASSSDLQPKTIYSSLPVLRDFRREAAAFVPAAVRAKMATAAGSGTEEQPESGNTMSQGPGLASRPWQTTVEDVEGDDVVD